MSLQVFGLPVSRGVAIGRAVLVASSRVDVAHYFIADDAVHAEVIRLRDARDLVSEELEHLKRDLPGDAPQELAALLDVHLMLLHDDALTGPTRQWIEERHYNAEWALSAQLEVLSRQFDEMEDDYLRERKADLEQVADVHIGDAFRVASLVKGTKEAVGGVVVARTGVNTKTVIDAVRESPGLEALSLGATRVSAKDAAAFASAVADVA